jgi:hypothetical protein
MARAYNPLPFTGEGAFLYGENHPKHRLEQNSAQAIERFSRANEIAASTSASLAISAFV